MKTLTASGKRALRAKAHALKPVVIVGEKGVTDTVLQEIDRALFDHELIKVKIAASDQEEFSGQVEAIESKLSLEVVQKIGHIVVLYRKSSKK
jgi:RNA-binding protein